MLIPSIKKERGRATDCRKNVKKIALFGSTGSVGESTLSIVRSYPEKFSISVLVGGANFSRLLTQIEEFRPEIAALGSVDLISSEQRKEYAVRVKKISPHTELLFGLNAVTEIAEGASYDVMVAAVVGLAGLHSVYAATKRGKPIALANKESLICAGTLLTELSKKTGTVFLPVDSEHSALWQALLGNHVEDIRALILTASGGPFRNTPKSEFKNITKAEALNHPSWSMGKRITIDSSTLFNKGLELIEARWLYDMPASRIEAVIHPQSIVHSAVSYCDGTQIFQCSVPDMKGAIGFALSYPENRLAGLMQSFDLAALGSLEFYPIDKEKFPAYRMAELVADSPYSGDAVVMNAADEVAVEAFLNDKIRWIDIIPTVQEAMNRFATRNMTSIEDVAALDNEVRSAIIRSQIT